MNNQYHHHPIRVDIKVGFTCNNNCRFCVVADMRHIGDQTTEKIKRDLELGRTNGAIEVVLTGGEPTIRPDIFEIVSHARNLGFRFIQIQTNGRMFYYKKFCEEIIKSGANVFSPALHGHKPEIHDYLTRSPGSFNQTVTGIKNLRELDQTLSTNSVITKQNYKFLPELARLFVDLKVDGFQFAFPHAVGNAYRNFDEIVPLKSAIMEYVRRALDIAIDSGVRVMVEAYPFCFMKNYEKYCSEFYIPPTEVRYPDSVTPDFERERKTKYKSKGPQCRECKYFSICEGPWREYPQIIGWDEFKPVKW